MVNTYDDIIGRCTKDMENYKKSRIPLLLTNNLKFFDSLTEEELNGAKKMYNLLLGKIRGGMEAYISSDDGLKREGLKKDLVKKLTNLQKYIGQVDD